MKTFAGPYVVRPRGILGTPRAIVEDLQEKRRFESRFYPNERRRRQFDYCRDFFMTSVRPQDVVNAPENYNEVYSFWSKNKYGQRRSLIAGGINTPRTAGSLSEAAELDANSGRRFVVRPLRHSRGLGYRTTVNPLDFVPGHEYISELWPKTREYRVIFVFGNPLIWLRKKPNEGVTADLPWGHENSFFQTINDTAGCRLSQTECVQKLSNLTVIKGSHIVAADILYNRKLEHGYAVLELNNCPSLSIYDNRQKVVQKILDRV